MNLEDVKWSQIKRVQELKVVRSMYIWLFIVPILVKSLAEVEDILELNIFDHLFKINIDLPFTFWVFYASAFCFVISNVIYQLKCPLLVQEHSSWRGFAEDGKGADHLDEYIKQLKLPEHEEQIGRNPEPTGAPGGTLQDSFWEFHSIAELKSTLFRLMAHSLNILAFLLIGVVVLQNMVTVIKHAIT